MQIQQVPERSGALSVSISPPSDILLGVAKAADPQKYRQAVEKLARASGSSPAEAESSLTSAVASAASSATGKGPPLSSQIDSTGKFHSAFRLDQVARAKKDPAKEFEAFFLQTAIESMLPKDSQALFGTGPAGNIWKSMLAEQIARELAQSTSFGIAEQIAAHAKMKKKKEDEGSVAPAAGLSPDKADAGQAASAGADRLTELRKLLSAEGQIALGNASMPNIPTSG
jgi:Rod binding domain-containing protein